MPITNYRQLDVWVKSMDLAEAIYAAVKHMPKQEEYRLTAQMIGAAISIPANIAEGNLRATRKDYAHFISIAQGSAAELPSARSCFRQKSQRLCWKASIQSVGC